MDEVQQDVNVPEVETGGDSSVTEQTAPDTAEVNAAESVPGPVPYERFKEVNDNLRIMREEIQQLRQQPQPQYQQQQQNQQPQTPEAQQAALIKEQLKPFLKELAPELGLVSVEDLRQKEADTRLQSDIARLSSTYSGKDGRPKFEEKSVIDYAFKNGLPSLEIAYKMLHESELNNWQVQQAIAKSKGIKTEGSDGSGSVNAGTTNDDLLAAAKSGDKQARLTLLKRIVATSAK